ncbi:hypothetical protein ABZ345_43835 [Lentzea sp. NPDC005914]|uniref:hypothetical protein n=1 Tax=Lentzea sp. NPDC005914 TaxID=3154572 RepID=UPI0033CC757A
MTQPPQWGPPPPARPPFQQPHPQPGHPQSYPPQGRPQQGYPQQAPPMYQQQHQPPPGWLPPKPSQLTVLALLNWVLAVGIFGIAAFVIMSFLMSGGTLIVGVIMAVLIALFGAFNALGALSINHPHFPNTTASQMSGTITLVFLGVMLVRSLRRGAAELVPSLGVAALMCVCAFSLFLASRPAVKQWIVAKHQLSLAQGHVPRNRR